MLGRSTWKLIVSFVVVAALLAGCGGKTTTAPAPAPAEKPAAEKADKGEKPAAKAEKPKFAMILPGAVEDADYNFLGYQVTKMLHDKLGLQTKYQEKVPPAEAERVARGFINDGYSIIAFHGGQFVTTVDKMARQFPDISFIVETAGPMPELPGNVWNIGRKYYQGFYAHGVLGALASGNKKVGVISGFKLPDFTATVNAVKQAVAEFNPNAQVTYIFTGDHNDPVKARQAAEAQINSGVDFIIVILNLGAQGVIEAARGKEVLLTTFYTDKTDLAPKNFTTSLLFDFNVPYTKIVNEIMKGNRGGYEEMRPGNGMSLSPIRNVPEDVAKKVVQVFDEVASGKRQVPEVRELKD